ncbi:unnamed protein product, partial [Brassica oleracea]
VSTLAARSNLPRTIIVNPLAFSLPHIPFSVFLDRVWERE